MKKLYVGLLALILLALVFFTFCGGQLYELGKPHVQTASVGSREGEEGLLFPGDALREDPAGYHVYVLCSETGYSRTIYTVERRAVEVTEDGRASDGYVHVSGLGELSRGDRVVTASDRALSDGERVLPG